MHMTESDKQYFRARRSPRLAATTSRSESIGKVNRVYIPADRVRFEMIKSQVEGEWIVTLIRRDPFIHRGT